MSTVRATSTPPPSKKLQLRLLQPLLFVAVRGLLKQSRCQGWIYDHPALGSTCDAQV
jgi:hypothetical protein